MARRTFIETDNTTFVRDMSTMALINNDASEFQRYKAQREKNVSIEVMNAEVTALKSELSEIKGMLLNITRVMSNGQS